MAKTIANQNVSPSRVTGRLATLHRLLEEEGLPWEALQWPIDDPEMRKRLVRYWRSRGFEPTTSQKLARAILPNGHFFGPEDWLTHLGDQVKFTKSQLAKVAEVPWSEGELKNPGVKQPEFIFLVPPAIDSKPVTLKRVQEVFPGPTHPKFRWDWYFTGEPFAELVVPFGWYSIVAEGMGGSENLPYSKQLTMIPEGYDNPHPALVAIANVLFYLANTRYMNTEYWVRTSEVSKKYGFRVFVGAYPVYGVSVAFWNDDADPSIRVAASRKFLNS